jgi:hypothetical protein
MSYGGKKSKERNERNLKKEGGIKRSEKDPKIKLVGRNKLILLVKSKRKQTTVVYRVEICRAFQHSFCEGQDHL